MKGKNCFCILAIAFAGALSVQSGCHPDKSSYGVPARVDEHPMADFLDTARNLNIIAGNETQPLEFGYTFTSSKKGVLFAIGCKMVLPMDSSQRYTMSLWDDSTHQLLLTKQVLYTDSSRFNMVDLSATGQTVQLKANYKYVVSISRVYGLKYEMPCYELAYASAGPWNIIPLTHGHITYLYQREGAGDATTTPAFPGTIINFNFAISGFIDIGFYATEY